MLQFGKLLAPATLNGHVGPEPQVSHLWPESRKYKKNAARLTWFRKYLFVARIDFHMYVGCNRGFPV